MVFFSVAVALFSLLTVKGSFHLEPVPRDYKTWTYSHVNPNCTNAEGGRNPCQDIRICNFALASIAVGGWPTLCSWVGKGVPKVCCGLPLVLGEHLMKQVDAEKARKRECGRISYSPGLSDTENIFYVILSSLPPPDTRNPERYDPPLDLSFDPMASPDGNKASQRGEFPWLVAIYKGSTHWCGGTLIDRIHVLSAAHCFVTSGSKADPSLYSVRVGDIHIAEGYPFKVDNIIVHEGFKHDVHYHDIAILTLSEEILSPTIPNICLPSPEIATKDLTGLRTTILGWDAQEFGGVSTPVAHVVDNVPVIRMSKCKEAYRDLDVKALPQGFTDDLICAGVDDVCQKDSGGLLMFKNNYQNLPEGDPDIPWVLLGVVSFGVGCGQTGYPGVYTRVSSYMDWIAINTNPPIQPK